MIFDPPIDYNQTPDIFSIYNEQAMSVACQLTMEYGIEVEAIAEYANTQQTILNRLYFEIAGQKFETSRDARKALEMKAFL